MNATNAAGDGAAPDAAGDGAAVIEVARALDFAARRHAAQRRKGLKAEPYVNHLAEVALLLAEATDGQDAALVAAGLLHDTVEDTGTTPAELAAAFGPDVATLVSEVTDDKTLPKDVRKRLQVQSAPNKSRRARMIKIADKIANLRSLAESPPLGWSAARKKDYVSWSREVVAACGSTNDRLERLFTEAETQARDA
jgi:(p)ppGpp synthase/HD superfamily hydrolase